MRWDTMAIVTTFKAVALEGIEVVFIVLAVGAAGHMILPASLGAVAAAVTVLLAALALRRPLTRVPENTLKLAVGVLIGSFGTFWMGEGLGFHWPGGDLAILGVAGGLLIVSLLVTVALRRQTATSQGSNACSLFG
jgi:Ca2+/H+ antiporter, TMEM165/GDT1 family